MFGYHLLKEDEQNYHRDGRSNGIWSYLRIYKQDGNDVILTIDEEYKDNIHQELNENGYVSSSIRISEEKLIKEFLEMIPFWKIKDYAEKDKREMISRHVEDLKRIGIEDNTVNYIKDIVLNYGTKK